MNQETNLTANHANLERITLELVGTTEKASRRVQYILMIIVTASIIAFSSFWNAFDSGWKNSRLVLMSNLCYSLEKDNNLYQQIMKRNEECIESSWDTLDYCRKNMVPVFFNTLTCGLNKDSDLIPRIVKDYKKSLNYYIDTKFYKEIKYTDIKDINGFLTNLKDAIAYYKPETLGKDGAGDIFISLRRMEEESVKTIEIPFFNIGFDINDLGFIGGFSFFILLLILYYSLKREFENLDTVYAFISANFKLEDRLHYYYLLSMSQVLSSPQLPVREIKAPVKPKKSMIKAISIFFLKHFSKALYFLPFILLFIIFIRDCITVDVGLKISKLSTLVNIWGGFVFTMLILISTLMCIFFSVKFDRKWDEIRGEVIAVLNKK